MTHTYALGIDVGSTTVKTVVLDPAGRLVGWRCLRAHGRPRQTLLDEAQTLAAELGETLDTLAARVDAVGLTGSGGRMVAALLGGEHINELVAQTRAVGEYHPEARTIVEIGGQDSKFLSVEWDEKLARMILVDMAMNNLCAAGTGAFLDQQAERLGISIERDFAELALQSEHPARIAGRCTVFAKSDMIHLQQKGTPLPDILAGLSLALARNFKSVIGKGKRFLPPIVFQGGVAYNEAVVAAFAEVLKLSRAEFIIPEHRQLMAALGSALIARDGAGRRTSFLGFAPLICDLKQAPKVQSTTPPLQPPTHPAATPQQTDRALRMQNGPPGGVYLGVDVGSITTKVVALDDAGRLLARRYLLTRGRPLEVVQRGLLEVGEELGPHVTVLGVGATGSGRHLTADYVGADVVRSEITAQARAALQADPAVDTIFEIGGQDSKFIRLEGGAVVDFHMNNACAAGTGSFLEEQADRLQIRIEEDFSACAFSSRCPAALGERCTVFMESDLIHHQQQGAQVVDLAAGLAYAIVENYLNRVVAGAPIGQRIFFQGGVAWNDSVTAAFEAKLGRPVIVPPHHDVTGAIGAALYARDERLAAAGEGEPPASHFRGFDLRAQAYATKSFICHICPNLCEISRVTIGDEPPIFYGARCDIYETRLGAGRQGTEPELPDLFAARQALLLGDYEEQTERRSGRTRVGIPRTLHFYDLFPYWRGFFSELGMDIVLSHETNPIIARNTKEHAAAEVCYPAKLVYGHVLDLLDRDVDLVFLPAVANRESPGPGQTENSYCLYIRSAGDMAAAGLHDRLAGVKVVKTALHFQWERLKRQELGQLAVALGVAFKAVQRADQAGMDMQQRFYAGLRRRGHELLEELAVGECPIVLVGRPYTIADMGVNQGLPFKLRRLGALPIPYDFLPVDEVDISADYRQMFWRSGQDILAAARLIRDDPRLHGIYVTSFNCGPDSFILSYFRRMMQGKAFLELELDDHTADAGIITRCEAFLESLRTFRQAINGGPQ